MSNTNTLSYNAIRLWNQINDASFYFLNNIHNVSVENNNDTIISWLFYLPSPLFRLLLSIRKTTVLNQRQLPKVETLRMRIVKYQTMLLQSSYTRHLKRNNIWWSCQRKSHLLSESQSNLQKTSKVKQELSPNFGFCKQI